MRLRPPSLLLLALPWLALGAAEPGLWGCGPPPPVAVSCLDSATDIITASSDRTYDFGAPGLGIDATGVSWLGISGHALTLTGDEAGCWVGGLVDGPYPEDAVYECSSEHGYTGGTCWAYHVTAAMAPDSAADLVLEDLHLGHYGDGVSIEDGPPTTVTIRRAYLHDLHDDAVEEDWRRHSYVVEDTLVERAFIFVTFDARSSADGRTPPPGWSITLRNNLVELHRFTHSYREKPGHGGFFKKDDAYAPLMFVTDQLWLAGPVMGNQVLFPNADTTVECAGNTLLWDGTLAAWLDALDAGDSSDAADNAERLLALNAAHPGCFEVVLRPPGQSSADFRAAHWDGRRDAWKSSHAAGGL